MTPATAAAAASFATSPKRARSRPVTLSTRASIRLTATRSTALTETITTIAPSNQWRAVTLQSPSTSTATSATRIRTRIEVYAG